VRKIPTIFARDWNGDRSRVVNEPHPDCGWVFAGEGVATRKYDGSCCMFKGGKLWKRREIKHGQAEPDGFVLAEHDDETGKTVGWVLVGDGPEDRWHREAMENCIDTVLHPDYRGQTFELIGPKVQGGIEPDYVYHVLLPHSEARIYFDAPRDYDGLRDWFAGQDIEGLVFHHPGGRMAKIKLRDFGLKRGISRKAASGDGNVKQVN
jgi:GNAT superfamily N-acetyltransferase